MLLEVAGSSGDDVVKTEDDCGLVLPGKPGVRALSKVRIIATEVTPQFAHLLQSRGQLSGLRI